MHFLYLFRFSVVHPGRLLAQECCSNLALYIAVNPLEHLARELQCHWRNRDEHLKTPASNIEDKRVEVRKLKCMISLAAEDIYTCEQSCW